MCHMFFWKKYIDDTSSVSSSLLHGSFLSVTVTVTVTESTLREVISYLLLRCFNFNLSISLSRDIVSVETLFQLRQNEGDDNDRVPFHLKWSLLSFFLSHSSPVCITLFFSWERNVTISCYFFLSWGVFLLLLRPQKILEPSLPSFLLSFDLRFYSISFVSFFLDSFVSPLMTRVCLGDHHLLFLRELLYIIIIASALSSVLPPSRNEHVLCFLSLKRFTTRFTIRISLFLLKVHSLNNNCILLLFAFLPPFVWMMEGVKLVSRDRENKNSRIVFLVILESKWTIKRHLLLELLILRLPFSEKAKREWKMPVHGIEPIDFSWFNLINAWVFRMNSMNKRSGHNNEHDGEKLSSSLNHLNCKATS